MNWTERAVHFQISFKTQQEKKAQAAKANENYSPDLTSKISQL